MKPDPKPEPEPEVLEPGGRKNQLPEKMTSEDLAAAYADATRLRAHELTWTLDSALGKWMKDARDVLATRGHLELIRDLLAVYFDPTRKAPVFGPGAALASQAGNLTADDNASGGKPRQIAAAKR